MIVDFSLYDQIPLLHPNLVPCFALLTYFQRLMTYIYYILHSIILEYQKHQIPALISRPQENQKSLTAYYILAQSYSKQDER